MALLRSKLQVQALIRRAETNGAFALVRKSGDEDAGSILVIINTLDGMGSLLGQTRDEDFNRVWEYLCQPESKYEQIEELITRRLSSDPDLWVVEVEDRKGRHFLVEQVL